jgi:hypothetical protein
MNRFVAPATVHFLNGGIVLHTVRHGSASNEVWRSPRAADQAMLAAITSTLLEEAFVEVQWDSSHRIYRDCLSLFKKRHLAATSASDLELMDTLRNQDV